MRSTKQWLDLVGVRAAVGPLPGSDRRSSPPLPQVWERGRGWRPRMPRQLRTRGVLAVLVTVVFTVSASTELAAQDTARRGWLGFSYDRDDDSPRTVVITDVYSRSPAERAGLRPGDIVLRLNDRPPTPEVMRSLRLEPDDEVRLRVRRNEREREIAIIADSRPRRLTAGDVRVIVPGRDGDDQIIIINDDTVRIAMDSLTAQFGSLQRQLRVLMVDSLGPQLRELQRTLREREPEFRALQERLRIHADSLAVLYQDDMEDMERIVFDFDLGHRAVAGAEFTALNPDLADYFGTDEGVLVLRVAPETPAARAGLEAGDVVIRVNGEGVRDVGELRRAVARAGRDDVEVRLRVIRKGSARELRLGWVGEKFRWRGDG